MAASSGAGRLDGGHCHGVSGSKVADGRFWKQTSVVYYNSHAGEEVGKLTESAFYLNFTYVTAFYLNFSALNYETCMFCCR
jgi:hypothetical protein